jgi:hypothetical protein
MFTAALLLLTAVPIESRVRPAAPVASGTRVIAIASAEVLRVGRIGEAAGPEDIAVQPRRGGDGQVLYEFR